MLLSSPRHTREDRKHWNEIRRALLRHPIDPSKIRRSILEIQKVGNAYVSCSWGKDSVVVLHLCHLALRTFPVVYCRFTDQANPDCDLVRDIWLKQWPTADYREVCMTRAEAGTDKHWREASKVAPLRITGMRGAESSNRQMMIFTHGLASKHVCNPIGFWSTTDSLAYMVQNELPLHPAYGMLGGGRYNVEQLRVHSIGGETGAGHGRREWEQEYYRDVLNRLETAKCWQK